MRPLENFKYYDKDRDDHHDDKCCKCPPKVAECDKRNDLHPVPGAALLECGTGFNPRVDTNITNITNPLTGYHLAEVDVDTTCFCFANVKIELSTLLTLNTILPGTAFTGNETITIQLSRQCCDRCDVQERVRVLDTWTINLPDVAAADLPETVPFSFMFCDEDVPLGECIYSVDIVRTTGFTGTGLGEFVDFLNTHIAALAVGGAQKCHR